MKRTPCVPSYEAPVAGFLLQHGRHVIPALGLALTALLTGCATTPPPASVVAQPAPRPYVAPPGLERVMGKTPAAVISLLGSPRLDRTEGKTRQLQYSGKACVLDLYAVGPVITYAEARKVTGLPNDPVACLNLIAPH